MKTVISSADAPAAVGPYSQAIAYEKFLFCSGQIPLEPATGNLAAEDVPGQTRQVLLNLDAVLRASGASFEHVVKTTVFMTDLGHFSEMNAVYAEFFGDSFPARSTFQVAALPKGAKVEIEAIAIKPN
jgi:2-iminobutanoate/2-iminopropanoate deaminase